MKAATAAGRTAIVLCRVSIHAAREGGDVLGIISEYISAVSIHAAREGGDPLGD